MDLIKPKHIEPGDTIGIVSPSGPISESDLEIGLSFIQKRGYRVVISDHALDRDNYLAGSDEDRARDLMKMFERPDVDAVLCSRGGYGAARLIPLIEPAIFRNNPKLLIGYSDITVLHLWLQKHVGLVSLYAPMPLTMTRPIPDHAWEVFWRALEVPEPLGEIPTWRAPIKTIAPGKATGRLTGGCLCLMTSSIGTPYEMDTENAIIVIEDVDEAPYRLDSMVNQLKLAGKWENCSGITIGESTRWEKYVKEEEPSFTPDQIWNHYFSQLNKPVISGFPFGHISDPLTLPYSISSELNAETGKLTILESATI